MSRWRTRILHPLRPPVGHDGKTALVPIEVQTFQFTKPLELECDLHWQVALLTTQAREDLTRRAFHAWKVWSVARRRQVATVVKFWSSDYAWDKNPLLVSDDPEPVFMRYADRVMLVQEGKIVRVAAGADPKLMFGYLAEPLAEDVMYERKVEAAKEMGMDFDDMDALRDL